MNPIEDAISLVYHEADLLDRREWAAWLALYVEDCVYWAPARRDETTMTQDPQREISVIYYDQRAGLEDRVKRITDGLSLASTLLPRTVHAVTNVRAEEVGKGVAVRSHWAVDSYDLRTDKQTRLFGRYEHLITFETTRPRIAVKRIEIMNARLPTVVDIYSI